MQTKKMKNIRYKFFGGKSSSFSPNGLTDYMIIISSIPSGGRHSCGGGGKAEAPRNVINQYFDKSH